MKSENYLLSEILELMPELGVPTNKKTLTDNAEHHF